MTKQINILGSLILLILFFASCKKDKTPLTSKTLASLNCPFVQDDSTMDGLIDETEREIMNDCSAAKFTTKAEIETNLIGEWNLVGHGEGWVPTVSQPCARINVEADQLTLEFSNSYIDTLTTHTWEVVENSNGFFRLDVTPIFSEGIYFGTFCENYMYGDATPLDGNMYLFEKN